MGVATPPTKSDRFRISVAPESPPPEWAFALAYRVSAAGIGFIFAAIAAIALGALSDWHLSSGLLITFGVILTGIVGMAERVRVLAYDRKRAMYRAREDQRVVERLLAVVEAQSLQSRADHGQLVWIAAGWAGRIRLKRALDIAVAVIGLFLVAPLLAVVALLIKLDSPGPVFVFTERIGYRGRRLFIPSFRVQPWPTSSIKRHPSLVRDSSPDLTRIGAFLHRTSLDALPSLFLVLTGALSLVGPFPGVPGTITETPLHFAPPGLVCWGIADHTWVQGMIDLPEYVSSQVEYVRGWTLARDVKTLLHTAQLVWVGGHEVDQRLP